MKKLENVTGLDLILIEDKPSERVCYVVFDEPNDNVPYVRMFNKHFDVIFCKEDGGSYQIYPADRLGLQFIRNFEGHGYDRMIFRYHFDGYTDFWACLKSYIKRFFNDGWATNKKFKTWYDIKRQAEELEEKAERQGRLNRVELIRDIYEQYKKNAVGYVDFWFEYHKPILASFYRGLQY